MDDTCNNEFFIDPLPAAIFPTLKKCARCPHEKPLSAFNNRRDSKDGKQSYCRDCQEDDRLLRAYNLTREQRDLMYDRQQGHCTVCQESYPHLYIYAFKGLAVLSLVCPRCMRICNGFNHNPDIIMSAINYLNYFGSRVLYGVILHLNEEWETSATGEPQRKMRNRPYGGLVNEETYEHWSLLNEHSCYICWEPRSTGRKFARDHKHVTNRNRGLLCFLCNTTLGTAQDDTELLHACATFLTSYLVPYVAGLVWITDEMVADADEEASWVSHAYSAVLPTPADGVKS
jgi:hypothetical protein